MGKVSGFPLVTAVDGDDLIPAVVDGVTSRITSDNLAASDSFTGRYVSVFSIDAYGGAGDGTTDNTTALTAAIAAAYAAGGGIVYIPEGVYRVDSQIVMPNTGTGSPYQQPPIAIQGVGTRWAGDLATGLITTGGSVLDLRYSGATAKIVTTGLGTLRLEGITLTDLGTSTTPFVLTTNTTLITDDVVVAGNPTKSGATCDQDGFILGGTSASSGTATTSAFRGWGSTIRDCKFTRIRRGVYGRAACNSVLVANNQWDILCGGTASAAAVEFDGTADQANGNILLGNLFEVQNYVYGVIFTDSSGNAGFGNSFWDPGGSYLAPWLEQSGSGGNSLLGTYAPGTTTLAGDPDAEIISGVARGQWAFGGSNSTSTESLVLMRPANYNPTTGDYAMLQVRRSLDESTDANAVTFAVTYNGNTAISGRGTYGPSLTISKVSNGSLVMDYQSIVRSTGDLLIYAGTANDSINASRGLFKDNPLATASRPAAATVGAGACYYDTTLSKPVWSDGTVWRDAAGTTV